MRRSSQFTSESLSYLRECKLRLIVQYNPFDTTCRLGHTGVVKVLSKGRAPLLKTFGLMVFLTFYNACLHYFRSYRRDDLASKHSLSYSYTYYVFQSLVLPSLTLIG